MSYPKVLVTWEDASDVDDTAWVNHDAPDAEAVIFEQLGFLVKLTAIECVLTQAVGKDQMASRSRIPTGMVRRIVEVSEGAPIAIPKKRTKR